MSNKNLLTDLIPPLLMHGLRIDGAKKHFINGKTEDKKLAGFLEYIKKVDYFDLQIDFSYFYYLLTKQIKLDSVKKELFINI